MADQIGGKKPINPLSTTAPSKPFKISVNNKPNCTGNKEYY